MTDKGSPRSVWTRLSEQMFQERIFFMTYRSNSTFLMRLCFLCAISMPLMSTAFAQKAAPVASRNKELSKIDSRATKIDDQFIRSAIGIAGEYEKAGDVARAVDYLHAMSLLKPGVSAIENKLEQLREEVLAANEFSLTLEPSNTWGKPVAFVREGKPLRVAAEGEYRLQISSVVGADGFPDDDVKSGLVENAPLGKLVGVIVELPGKSERKGKRMKEKEPEPFEIGAEKVIRPRHTGYLYLKVNLPEDSNPSGSLQVQLSGYVLAPDGKNIGN